MLKEQNALNSLYKIWPWLELGTFYRKVLTLYRTSKELDVRN